MLEDDSDDMQLTQAYFAEHHPAIPIKFLEQPAALMQYLDECNLIGQTLPALILIDKYIQVRSGIAVLQAIKTHPIFRQIPTVILSGSDLPADIAESYRLGANSYIVKPAYIELTIRKISTFVTYWFDVAELPVVSVGNLV